MKPPRFRRTMIAVVLLSLGAIFTLLGELGVMGVSVPMRGGEAWMFLPIGILLLLAGAILALSVGWTKRRQDRLRAEGVSVPAEAVQIRYHPMV